MEKYKKILTQDGSTTFYSPMFDEACHSTSGASEETQLHYINGCQIKDSPHDPLQILEVGFGTGLGFMETLKALPKKQFKFISLEIDPKMIELAKDNYPLFKELKGENILTLKKENYELTILLGDARKALPKYLETNLLKFHAIYQDAFSPKRNPILWTKEWFELLFRHADSSCIMSTYSSSSSIRKSMIAGGWKLGEGEKFGPKRSSTRAFAMGTTSLAIEEKLKRSPAITLTDENSKDYHL